MDQFKYLNEHPYVPPEQHRTLLELTYYTEITSVSSIRYHYLTLCHPLRSSYYPAVTKKKAYLQSHILTTWKFKQYCCALAIAVQKQKITFFVARHLLLMLFQVDIPMLSYENTHRQNERPCTITSQDLFHSLDRYIFYQDNDDNKNNDNNKNNNNKNNYNNNNNQGKTKKRKNLHV